MEYENYKIGDLNMLSKYNYTTKCFIAVLSICCYHNALYAYYLTDSGTVPTPGLSAITEPDFSVNGSLGLPPFSHMGLDSWVFSYKINNDSISVGLIIAQGITTRNEPMMMGFPPPMDSIVTNARDGNKYILTSLGNNYTPLLIDNFTITPNIRRLAAYAFAPQNIFVNLDYNSYDNRYLDENTEFDYVGIGSLNSTIIGNSLKIADNGELHTISYCPPIIKLGRNVTLKSIEYMFITSLSDSIRQLYSYSEVPPKIETYKQQLSEKFADYAPEAEAKLFSDDDFYKAEHATLHVPAGCKEAYASDPEWGRFENIVEMEPVALEEIISDESQGISISTDHGQIYVQSAEDREVLVFAMSGLLLKRDHTREGSVSIDLQPGAYLVKVGDKFIRKVAVR